MQHHLYTQLIAPLSQTLSARVMSIGLFLVAVGYLRSVFVNRDKWDPGDFAKRVILLASVLLFSLYVLLSYQVGMASLPVAEDAATTVPLEIKLKILMLAPIELMLAGIEATLFLILGVDALTSITGSDEPTPISTKVTRLFVITSMWHFIVIIWWLLWLGTGQFSSTSLIQHSILGALQLSAGLIWTRMVPKISEPSRPLAEWFAVAAYASIVIGTYCTRMVWYIDRAAEVG